MVSTRVERGPPNAKTALGDGIVSAKAVEAADMKAWDIEELSGSVLKNLEVSSCWFVLDTLSFRLSGSLDHG